MGIILLIILLILWIFGKGYYKENMVDMTNKRKIWTYWENREGKTTPPYIKLCFKIMKKKCSKYYDIIILNNNTVKGYIPNLRKDIDELPLALKTDYIRVLLLNKYGGIWIDADTIVMKNLDEINEKLDEGWDFIGFGCTGIQCTNGYPKPSNGVMASKKNGKLMKRCEKRLNELLDTRKQFSYYELGKYVLWDEIKKLMKLEKYDYYHYPSYADGSRNEKGFWIAPKLIFKEEIKLLNRDKILFVFLANSIYCGKNKVYNWFCDLTEEEIINGDYFVSSLFRKALSEN